MATKHRINHEKKINKEFAGGEMRERDKRLHLFKSFKEAKELLTVAAWNGNLSATVREWRKLEKRKTAHA